MKIKLVVLAFAATASLALTAGSQDSVRSDWSGVYTADQAKNGGATYAKNCASCHGDQLEGGNEVPALSGDDFLAEWNGRTANELFDRIHTTMPADHPGTLSPQDTTNLVAHIFATNKLPAGDTDLPDQPDALKKIRLDAKSPDK